MVEERFLRRRAQVRTQTRQRRLRRTILVTTFVVLLLAGVLLERSSLVALAEVRVTGLQRLDEQEVRSAADLQLGTSTLRLRLGAATERVEALPLVASADIHRVDPLTVQIDVRERQATVMVAGEDGVALVDDEGVVLVRGREEGLPLITLTSRLPELGATVAEVPALANAHAALRQLSGPLRALVSRYEAREEDDLWLHLTDGTVVWFGRAERVDEKARALGAILEDLDGQPVQTIDVRAPSRPVVVP